MKEIVTWNENSVQKNKEMKKLIKQLTELQHEFEDVDREFARTIGRTKDAIRIKFNIH